MMDLNKKVMKMFGQVPTAVREAGGAGLHHPEHGPWE
jgi:hypothetical protein